MERLVYLFDVDGTLTPPMQKMESGTAMRLLNWMRGKEVYIVAGSDKHKVYKQLPASILSRLDGIFVLQQTSYGMVMSLFIKMIGLLPMIFFLSR